MNMDKEGRIVNFRICQFITQQFNDVIGDYFDKSKYPQLNRNITSDNYFGVDAIGIPIRKDGEDRKSIFGWKRYGNEFYHYLVDVELIGKISKEELMKNTISLIKQKHASQMKDTKQQMMRHLITLYGEEILH